MFDNPKRFITFVRAKILNSTEYGKFTKAMNPAEPHNPSLVRKHYAALRAEMDDVFGKLFEKLSKINEKK